MNLFIPTIDPFLHSTSIDVDLCEGLAPLERHMAPWRPKLKSFPAANLLNVASWIRLRTLERSLIQVVMMWLKRLHRTLTLFLHIVCLWFRNRKLIAHGFFDWNLTNVLLETNISLVGWARESVCWAEWPLRIALDLLRLAGLQILVLHRC